MLFPVNISFTERLFLLKYWQIPKTLVFRILIYGDYPGNFYAKFGMNLKSCLANSNEAIRLTGVVILVQLIVVSFRSVDFILTKLVGLLIARYNYDDTNKPAEEVKTRNNRNTGAQTPVVEEKL